MQPAPHCISDGRLDSLAESQILSGTQREEVDPFRRPSFLQHRMPVNASLYTGYRRVRSTFMPQADHRHTSSLQTVTQAITAVNEAKEQLIAHR